MGDVIDVLRRPAAAIKELHGMDKPLVLSLCLVVPVLLTAERRHDL